MDRFHAVVIETLAVFQHDKPLLNSVDLTMVIKHHVTRKTHEYLRPDGVATKGLFHESPPGPMLEGV